MSLRIAVSLIEGAIHSLVLFLFHSSTLSSSSPCSSIHLHCVTLSLHLFMKTDRSEISSDPIRSEPIRFDPIRSNSIRYMHSFSVCFHQILLIKILSILLLFYLLTVLPIFHNTIVTNIYLRRYKIF